MEWEDVDRKKREREYKLLELTGLIAMSRIASEIIVPSYDAKTETVNWSEVSKLIGAISDSEEMDWSKGGMFPRNGFVGASDIHRHLQSLISRIASSRKRRN